MMDSGVYDSSGNLKNGTQADLYQKGLENQSRIGMNKTIGVGKEDLSGQAGVDKMNAIQYGAQAGVQGEIASGKALKNVYGKDLKGSTGMSYADTAEANATMQNLGVAAEGAANKAIITDAGYQQLYGSKKANATVSKAQELGSGKANQKYLDENGGIDGVASLAETSTDAQNIKNTSTTQSLRDEFGDVAGGTGKGNYADTTYQLAKKSHKSSKGEAKAIKKVKGDTIEKMAESKADQDYGSFESSVKAIMDSDGVSRDEAIAKMNSANISDNATKSLKGVISFDSKKDLGIVNEDGSLNLDKEIAYTTENKNGKISEHTGKYGDALRSQVSLNTGSEIGETMKIPDTARANADKLIKESDEKLKQASPGVFGEAWDSLKDYGNELGSFFGLNERDKKYEKNYAIRVMEGKEYSDAVSGFNQSTMIRGALGTGNYTKAGLLGGTATTNLSAGGIIGNTTGTGGDQIQGSFQSGVSYSHNESSNYSYGVTASGGSAFAGMAHSMGMNMGAFASMSSNLAAASQVAGLAAMALPGGRLGGMLSNIGAISADSTYAMGVGSAVKARRGEASSAINQMGKLQDGIVEARTNFNEAKMNYTASGGKRWEHFSDEQAQAHFAGIKRALGERQERLQYLQSNEGPAVQIRAVKEQISDLTKERSQMDSLLKYRTAEQKYTAAQNNFNNGINSLGDYGRTAWEQNPYNIERRSQFKTEEGIRTGEQMRFQEGVEADYKTAVSNRLDVDGAKSLGFEGAKDLIKAIDDGRVEVYSEDGYNKFRWAK